MNQPVNPLRPERVRSVEKPFAWIPFRLLTDGYMANLSDRAKLVYLLLCLAADRNGLSFYGDKRILSYFQLGPGELQLARRELIEKDLVAYDGHLYQVLSLPKSRPQSEPPSEKLSQRGKIGQPDRLGNILQRIAKLAE
jgi:hypothetical protein